MTAAANVSLAAGMQTLSLGRAGRHLRRLMRSGIRTAVQFAVWQDLPRHAAREALAAVRRDRPDLFEPIEAKSFEAEAKRQARDAELNELVKGHRKRLLKEWRAALTAGGWPKPDRPPPPTVFRVTAGTGKTHAVQVALLDAIADLPDGVPFSAAFLAPDHGLVERHAAKAREMIGERGMDVAVISLAGRDHQRPDGARLCKRSDLAGEVAKNGLSVRSLVCGPASEGVAACPGCDYWKQGDGLSKRALIFGTHAGKRGNELPGGVRCPALAIVDENPLLAMKVGKALPVELDTLRNWRIWPDQEEFSEDRDEVTAVARNLCDLAHEMDAGRHGEPGGWLKHLEARGVTPERLRDAVGKAGVMVDRLWRHADDAARPHRQKEAALLAVLDAPNGLPVRHKQASDVRNVLAAVLINLEAGFPFLQSVTFAPEKKDGPIKQALVHRAHPLVNLRGGRATQHAIIALDATAHPLLIPFIWGRDARMVRIDVERHEAVTMVPDAPTSHTKLGIYDNDNTPRGEREAHDGNRDRLRATLLASVAMYGEGNLAVTLPKGVRHVAESVPGIGAVFHHGATRGRNDAENCTGMVVAGRKQPQATAIENMARALVHGHGVELTLPGEYTEPATAIRMRDGIMRDGVSGRSGAPNHVDPIVQALLETERDCENEQAADRIRSVRADPTMPKHVTMLGPLSGNRPIDAVVPWVLHRVLTAAAADPAFRDGRPVPLTHGPWLERAVPDLLRGAVGRSADARRQAADHLGTQVAIEIAALVAREGERWSRVLNIILSTCDHRLALCVAALSGRKGVKWLVARDADAFSDAAISDALGGAAVAEKHVVTAGTMCKAAAAVSGLRTYSQFQSDMEEALARIPLPPMAGGLVAWRLAPAAVFGEYLSAWGRVAQAAVGARDNDDFLHMAGRIAASSVWSAGVEDARSVGIALLAYGILAHCAPLMFRDTDAPLGVTASVALRAIPEIRQAIMELADALRTVKGNEEPAVVALAIHAAKVAAMAALLIDHWERMARGGLQGMLVGRRQAQPVSQAA